MMSPQLDHLERVSTIIGSLTNWTAGNQWRLVSLDPTVSSSMTGITAGLLIEFADDAKFEDLNNNQDGKMRFLI